MELQHRYSNDNNFKKHLAACSSILLPSDGVDWDSGGVFGKQLTSYSSIYGGYFMIPLYGVILTGTIMIINCVSIDNLLRSYIFPHTPPGSSGRAVPAYLYAN